MTWRASILVATAMAVASLLFVSSTRASEPAVDLFPRAASAYIVAINGKPRWSREPDSQHAPASLTKVLTALVVLEQGWQPHAVITVSARAGKATGARLGLRAGDRAYAAELLEAMLVASANDACLALAEATAG